MPLAYSYIRFSTKRQALGDSLRRQLELADTYVAKHGLELADVTYRDLGVSAFDRSNTERGQLGVFVAAVRSGAIPRGSYLLVEHLDRLTRADLGTALGLILELANLGITVVTLTDDRVWNQESARDMTQLICSLALLQRAHEESKTKGERVSAAWRAKQLRAAKEIVTREVPRWLRPVPGGFEPIPERVASIETVFKLRVQALGYVAIARRMNEMVAPVPGNCDTWHNSLIVRLLRNRALLGEYQPSSRGKFNGPVVMGYFPRVIPDQLWTEAVSVSTRRGRFPGRRGVSARNWLYGLVRCSCGASFVRKSKDGNGYARYYCTARVRAVTSCQSVAQVRLEATVLHAVGDLVPAAVASGDAVTELQNAVLRAELQVHDLERKRQRFLDAIAMSDDSLSPLVNSLREIEVFMVTARQSLDVARSRLMTMQASSDLALESLQSLASDPERHLELREVLSKVVDRIVVHPSEDYLEVHVPGIDVPIVVSYADEAKWKLPPGISATR